MFSSRRTSTTIVCQMAEVATNPWLVARKNNWGSVLIRPNQATSTLTINETAKPARFLSTDTASSNITRSSKHCKCKRSRCLKMYCECFALQRLCRGCQCKDCGNTEEMLRCYIPELYGMWGEGVMQTQPGLYHAPGEFAEFQERAFGCGKCQ